MQEYKIRKRAEIGFCMDVRGYGGRIYAIRRQGRGALCVLDGSLSLLSTFEGIGNARQIEIADGIAYITAREDGLWIFDVREELPRLLCHYRTVEFATGIAIAGGYAFVSCRQYGVETVDVRDPAHPRYVGMIRIGEAQSACVSDGVLYGGVWGKMKVVAVDISDVRRPEVLSEIPLRGRGDGVVCRDGILYAVTGQHRRGIVNVTDESDPCFGTGNGVEVFDVRDPRNPKPLGSDSFGKGHHIAFDMWKPLLCGNTLVCSDSVLGVFGYDATTLARTFRLSLPEKDGKPDPVTGTAVIDGKLYVTSLFGGLSVFDAFEFDEAYRYDTGRDAREVPALPAFGSTQTVGSGAALEQIYCGDFPVLAVAEGEGVLAVACGDGGVQLCRSADLSPVARSAPFFCCDVRMHGNSVFAASAEQGLRVLRFDGERIEEVSRCALGGSVLQVELSEHGEFLVCAVGQSRLVMLDVRDPARVSEVCDYEAHDGPLYGENFLPHRLGKAIALFWHRHGLVYTDPEHGDRAFHRIFYPMKNGFTGYCPANGCEVCGGEVLFVHRGGYLLLPERGEGYADERPVYRPAHPIRGKLFYGEGLLIATDRAEGTVSVTDVSDLTHPVTVAALRVDASVGIPRQTSAGLLFPARYAGLLRLTLPKEAGANR